MTLKTLTLQVNDYRPDREVVAYDYIEYVWEARNDGHGLVLVCSARTFSPDGSGGAEYDAGPVYASWIADGRAWRLVHANDPLDRRREYWPDIPPEFLNLLAK